MRKIRDIKYPIDLTPAQLSVLLAMLRATELLGANNQQLFPNDEAERMALWQQGQKELERDGWLVKVGAYYDPNEQLMLLIAAIAAPRLVIHTQRLGPAQSEVASVTHYLSEQLIVEQTYTGDVYRFTVLASVAVMTDRLAHTFALPAQKQDDIHFSLGQAEAEKITAASTMPQLLQIGIAEKIAQIYLDTLRQIQFKGLIRLLKTRLTTIVEQAELGLLVSHDGVAWVAEPQAGRTRYTQTDIASFQSIMQQKIDQLYGGEND